MSHKEMKKNEKNNVSLYNISKLLGNNSNNLHQCFLYHPNLGAFCIIIDQNEQYENISKSKMIYFFKYANELKIKSIFLLINKKNKDIQKITQTIMVMGFKKDHLIRSTILDDGNDYSIFKMYLDRSKENIDEVEDIDI